MKSFFIIFALFLYTQGFSNPLETDSLLYYHNKNKYKEAIAYAKKMKHISLQKNDLEKYSEITIAESKVYFDLKDYEKAISTLFEGLRNSKKPKINRLIDEYYINIALNYNEINDTINAKKYFHNSLKFALLNNKEKSIRINYQNLFRLHFKAQNLDSAYYFMTKKREIDNRHDNDYIALTSSYNNYFVFYTAMGESEKAKMYLDSCYHYSVKYNIKETLVGSLSNYSYHYIVNKQPLKAIESLEHALETYGTNISNNDLLNIYYNMYYAYEILEDYKNANKYLDLYSDLLVDLHNTQLNSAVRNIEMKYQLDKVEEEYKLRSKKLEDSHLKNKKIIIVFISLFAFALILFYFFYQNQKLKQYKKIKDIEDRVKEHIISASLDGQEFERKKLSEILHDNISALLTSAGLQISAYIKITNSNNEELHKARKLLKEAHDKVRDLSHDLVPPLLMKMGLIYAIQDLCDRSNSSILKFNYKLLIDKNHRFNKDFELKTYYIIVELFNNIIKHSQATEATILIDMNHNMLYINIEDNGIGFIPPSHNEIDKSSGIGLVQITSRIKTMNGKIRIVSKLQKGTSIFIKLEIPEIENL